MTKKGVAALILPALLSACIPGGRGRPVVRDLSSRDFGRCLSELRAMGVEVTPLKDRTFPNGCAARQSLKLVSFGIPTTNLTAMRCPLVRAFVLWSRDAQALATAELGSPIRKLESYGSFACRPVNNKAGNRLSEHGFANAVDIAAFQLTDGRRITVRGGWGGPDSQVRGFLRAAHRAGCRRFGVVLGPDANALHADHFHFDMGKGPYCR
ncbi:extensin family protein [Sphingomonas jatrophae]|uniref:Extensin-like protein C-terminus n=1 Tax=Sphingomonas jatrophae TaxID=1166337 RepID=A0A1I6KY83_9SPHN|nr:extensin family protein [Sphingomonas jatrophae]SFR96196.1 Extensin-like protein C-terminus [Sphingomonas jatrophae]